MNPEADAGRSGPVWKLREFKNLAFEIFLQDGKADIQHFRVQTSVPIPAALDRIARCVVDSAFAVHKELGPGLLESVYEACFCEELRLRNIPFRRQVSVPIVYKTLRLESGLRLDLLVEDSIIGELKSVRRIELIFEAQILSYLRLSHLRLGFLINFNVPLIKDGIFRFAS